MQDPNPKLFESPIPDPNPDKKKILSDPQHVKTGFV